MTATTESAAITTTAERVWRVAGIVGMALGMLSLIAATVIQWFVQPSDPAGTPIDITGENPGLWLLVGLLAVLGPLAWVAGIVSTTMLVRTKGWTLTTIGGYLTAAGLVGGVGHLAIFFGLIADAAGAGLDGDTGRAILQADDASILSNVLLYGFLVGFSLGPILLTIGLRMARLVPVWVPVAAIVMVVANFVGGIPAGIVQLVAVVATFGPMVLLLARRRGVSA
ncbi:hypothetical protein BKA04_000726 [Cryobacterium mesophilum]|uniref:DUF4386 family protein n=1 Tax=Terrimesophilobacter mesophilus TaxID=433647 RepID=A0A4V3I9F2_9MICO|nr:hypothetical protein [Terrimesophilobacter mesophilus]MBB5632503.1 hypothetical protein [Terrimesophilobacter mesophilus]TFB79328.1 hypothetical protein E3N84_04220 [Terrimesophilobacter mesophilus]